MRSRYSRSFYSDRLTGRKHDALLALGETLRSIKNELSELVNSDLMKYLLVSKIDFQKQMLPLIKDRVHSNFTKQLCDDVLKSYQTRFDFIMRRIVFEKVTKLEATFYKRDTKDKKKGDRKGLIRQSESTKLTKILSYLARYGKIGTVEYIQTAMLSEVNESKKTFYLDVLEYCKRYGFERLLRLAVSKRATILSRYKEPIEFKSLVFRGRSRLSTDIVSYNTNFGSVIKAFICISWTDTRKSLKIPVKYSKSFHGNMKQYTNGTDTSYTVCFESERVRIILSRDGDREFPDASDSDVFVGFDVNSKHNQITGSNGIVVDHNREALEELIKELLKIDQLKVKNPYYVIGVKKSNKIVNLRRQIKHHTEHNCSYICRQMNEKGENHAVFEDLDNSFGRSFAKNDANFNYNRLIKEMHLSSTKDTFEHIARKYKISVSFVQPEYTSQECHECHYIDEGNRKTQEEFVCLQCKHEDNADNNSAKNICERVSDAVLRDVLLTKSKLGNGSYSPKNLKRFEVKEMLLSLRDTANKQKESQ